MCCIRRKAALNPLFNLRSIVPSAGLQSRVWIVGKRRCTAVDMLISNGVLTCLFIFAMIFALSSGYPSKEKLKIRIHVPVKHHTHVHTKTIIKKVPLPVPVPVKMEEPKKEHHHHDHYAEPELEPEDDFEGYDLPKKKRRTRHPFV